MERLKYIKESLLRCVEAQMECLQWTDTKELGEAIDMIKDLEEAIYYKTITEAMEQKEYHLERDMDKDDGRMYYDGTGKDSSGHGNPPGTPASRHGNRHSENYEYPLEVMRDRREGKSPSSRRMYMEAKETHQDRAKQMRELDKYMQELAQDVTEMITGSSPEEKQYLEKKLGELSSKVSQLK